MLYIEQVDKIEQGDVLFETIKTVTLIVDKEDVG
jgi:hypothetical protein